MSSHYKIKKDSISSPHVEFTDKAWDQLHLIMNNDFTVEGKFFRILISGKNCDGPLYSMGMADKKLDDFKIDIQKNKRSATILIDPFSAFYLQEVKVDFIQDFTGDGEGFILINHNQHQYTGKFWLKDEMKIPPGQIRKIG